MAHGTLFLGEIGRRVRRRLCCNVPRQNPRAQPRRRIGADQPRRRPRGSSNDYEVDLVASLGRFGFLLGPGQHSKECPSIRHEPFVALPPEPPGEQAADHYDGEAYRSLPYGVWRFIEAPSIRSGSSSGSRPDSHLPMSESCPDRLGLSARNGRSRCAWLCWPAVATSEGLPSGRALEAVGSFHHL